MPRKMFVLPTTLPWIEPPLTETTAVGGAQPTPRTNASGSPKSIGSTRAKLEYGRSQSLTHATTLHEISGALARSQDHVFIS
jgi:hypothetical protein